MKAAYADSSVPSITFPNPNDSIIGMEGTAYLTRREVKPMLYSNVAKWSQEAPYNMECPVINGIRGVSGCGPVAVGMLLSYYKYPETIDGEAINWNAIVYGDSKSDISHLVEILADSVYLNAQYHKNLSGNYNPYSRGINSEKVVNPTLSKLGYDVSEAWNNSKFELEMEEVFNFMKSGDLLKAPI